MWFSRQHKMNRYKALALLVLCLFVSHTVLEGLHHAMVQHVTCPEHGEQLHHHSGHDAATSATTTRMLGTRDRFGHGRREAWKGGGSARWI